MRLFFNGLKKKKIDIKMVLLHFLKKFRYVLGVLFNFIIMLLFMSFTECEPAKKLEEENTLEEEEESSIDYVFWYYLFALPLLAYFMYNDYYYDKEGVFNTLFPPKKPKRKLLSLLLTLLGL